MNYSDKKTEGIKERHTTRPRRSILLATIALVAIADQLTKVLALSELDGQPSVDVVGTWLQFTLVRNPGAAFSFGTGATWVFTTIQLAYIVIALVFSKWLRSPFIAITAGLVAGGALGNLLDRLFREPSFYLGHVIDFISVRGFAVFNIADCAISVGIFFVVVWLLFSKEPDRFAAEIQQEKEEHSDGEDGPRLAKEVRNA